jgi:peptidoglycan/LPS O-acetylase OafA/YrhL
MIVTQPEPVSPPARWRFAVATAVASVLCLAAIAIVAFSPQQFRYEKRVYEVGDPIASFTINAFVARYQQASEPFDRQKHAGITGAYTVVNTVEWTTHPQRLAVIPAGLALLVIVLMLRKRPTPPPRSFAA